ncbi:hypothetical protein B0H14DRAFT_3576033 [Mycena olivaceomarginata]|nr:hypothetical protein B0H14DRAFT_3576033 [Mycena olivaceomarginata]
MSLIYAPRLHISGSTSNQVAGHLNQYNVAGSLIQSGGENGGFNVRFSVVQCLLTFHAVGIILLQGKISGDTLHNSEQRFPPPLCHPDTRTAVQNTIQCWAVDTDYQAPNVMWLYGPAGAGKSAVAQSMAENWGAENKLAASFFFARWRVGVEADSAICNKTLEEQFHALIVNQMSCVEIGPSREFNFVIIDGLDECDSKPTQSRIINIIFQALVENNLPIRFLICSRPEPHIRETFDSLPKAVQFRRLALDETFNPGRDRGSLQKVEILIVVVRHILKHPVWLSQHQLPESSHSKEIGQELVEKSLLEAGIVRERRFEPVKRTQNHVNRCRIDREMSLEMR